MSTVLGEQKIHDHIQVDSLSVGFDLRLHDMHVIVPDTDSEDDLISTTFDNHDRSEVVYSQGTRREVVETLEKAGYRVAR